MKQEELGIQPAFSAKRGVDLKNENDASKFVINVVKLKLPILKQIVQNISIGRAA